MRGFRLWMYIKCLLIHYPVDELYTGAAKSLCLLQGVYPIPINARVMWLSLPFTVADWPAADELISSSTSAEDE